MGSVRENQQTADRVQNAVNVLHKEGCTIAVIAAIMRKSPDRGGCANSLARDPGERMQALNFMHGVDQAMIIPPVTEHSKLLRKAERVNLDFVMRQQSIKRDPCYGGLQMEAAGECIVTPTGVAMLYSSGVSVLRSFALAACSA